METKQFSIDCLVRSYTYTATVSKKTGKLLHIRAGCRDWRSWAAAYEHYERFGVGVWSNARIINGTNNDVDLAWMYASREEAIAILRKLNRAVTKYKNKVREARNANRKRKPAVKKK